MINLYKLNIDCGRMGELNGTFLADPEDIELLIGKHVYFGEVLGKHSEIEGNIEADDIELITDNQEFLQMAAKLNIDITSGHDPFNYFNCRNCGNVLDIKTDDTICQECGQERAQ